MFDLMFAWQLFTRFWQLNMKFNYLVESFFYLGVQ